MRASLLHFLFWTVFLTIITLLNINYYQNSTFFSKTFIFGIYSIFFLTYFVQRFRRWKTPIHISKIDIGLFVLLLFLLLNFFFSKNMSFSLRFYELISSVIFYAFLRFTWQNNKVIIYSILGILVAFFINILYGFGQFFGVFQSYHSSFPITGSFFNPAPFAGWITIGSIFYLFIFLYREQFYRHFYTLQQNKLLSRTLFYGSIINILGSIILLIILQSRASWLALLGGFIFLLLKRIKCLLPLSLIKKSSFLSLGIVLLIVLGIYFYSLRKTSADGRILIWKISSEIIKDYPLTGVGLDNFKVHYMNYQAHYFSTEETLQQEIFLSDNVVYAFNDFLQFFTEQGFVGFFLVIVVFYLALKQGKSVFGILGCATLICLCVFSFFSYPLQILPLKILGLMALALCAFSSKEKTHIFTNKTLRLILLSMMIILIFLQKNSLYHLHIGYYNWKKAMNSYFSNDFEQSMFYFQKAYPFLKTNGEFLMHYGKALSLIEESEKSNEILHQAKNYLNNSIIQTSLGDNYKNLKDYKNAEKHYQTASNMIPNRLYPHYLLAKMFQEEGNIEKAKQQAKILLEMPIKVPSMVAFEMQEEMKTLLNK